MISVIVLNWNGREHLRACLTSLRRQVFQDFEVILVDNGSTDGSLEYVRQNFPEVRLIALECNLGFCGGNNVGIRQANGELLALLNNDTEVSLYWLDSLNQAAQAHPEIGSFASKMLFLDNPQTLDTAGDEFHVAGFGSKRGWNQLDSPQFNQEQEVFSACAGAALYRRDMLDHIGFLDEDFFANGEDIDLGFRAQLSGYHCIYVPKAVVYHKGGATIGQNLHWFYLIRRNQIWIMVKDMPAGLWLRHLPAIIFYNLSSLLYHSLKGRGRLILTAYLDALRDIPRMLQKRRHVQSLRTVSNDYLEALLVSGNLMRRARTPVTSSLPSSYSRK